MSFSQALPTTPIDEAADAIDAMTPTYELGEVASELFDAGKDAAQDLLSTLKQLNDGSTHVNMSIHGHGHEPGASDVPFNSLTVQVSEAAAPTTPTDNGAPIDEDGVEYVAHDPENEPIGEEDDGA